MFSNTSVCFSSEYFPRLSWSRRIRKRENTFLAMKGYVTFMYVWNKFSHHRPKLLLSGCIMHDILCHFLPPSNSAWSRAWRCLVWRKCGLSSDPRLGTQGPKHQPNINNNKYSVLYLYTSNCRISEIVSFHSSLIHMSDESNLGFLNLSKLYRVSQKTWIFVWWAIKGPEVAWRQK